MSDENNHVDEFKLNNRSKNRLRFNICGAKYEILESTLQRFPLTPLAQEEWRAQFWDETRGEYYLDRNRTCFKAVLTYYQSEGILHRPEYVLEKLFFQELEFYGLRKPKEKVERVLPKNSFQKGRLGAFRVSRYVQLCKGNSLAKLHCGLTVYRCVLCGNSSRVYQRISRGRRNGYQRSIFYHRSCVHCLVHYWIHSSSSFIANQNEIRSRCIEHNRFSRNSPVLYQLRACIKLERVVVGNIACSTTRTRVSDFQVVASFERTENFGAHHESKYYRVGFASIFPCCR